MPFYMIPKLHFQVYTLELLICKSLGNGNALQYKVSDELKTYLQHAGGTPQKERSSGTSLSKAEGSGGEVSLLSANAAPQQARVNQKLRGFRLSSFALCCKLLVYIGKQGGFARDFL